VSEEPKRLRLTPAQIKLMIEVVAGASSSLRQVADRIARGDVIPQDDVNELADFLADAMEYTDEEGLTERGVQIDDIIGVVYQLSEDFFR
jgi:methylmalonyl-CoA mutase N-terminal domain/subunit